MNGNLGIGQKVLNETLPCKVFEQFEVRIVRDLTEYQHMSALRSATFMAEQDCPFDEEFDGNDLNATHLVGYENGRPVATLRLRWFAIFAKLERVCVLPSHRGTSIVKLMLAACFELAARKGYRSMIGHIQARLLPLWSNVFSFTTRSDRPPLSFSNFDYIEIDIPLPKHPDAITYDDDPYLIIRPEGAWDCAGVLDKPAQSKTGAKPQAA